MRALERKRRAYNLFLNPLLSDYRRCSIKSNALPSNEFVLRHIDLDPTIRCSLVSSSLSELLTVVVLSRNEIFWFVLSSDRNLVELDQKRINLSGQE
jgi:hypothetical protein